ncbi:MAG: MBL fold metallo-hydrolase [Erysipelotrichaceae bacterium]
MSYALLASGSKGNCCVIEAADSRIVIDCGSTKRYLTQCFNEINFDYHHLDGLLITHGHSDHISQLKMFDQIPTYASIELETHFLTKINPYEEFDINHIHVLVLPMSHDAQNTVGYVLTWEDKKMVYITDTGYIKEEVKQYIKNADYYIIESNHDIEMLMQTNRPIYLKQRIINDSGHLCNEVAANMIVEVMGDKTKEIVLAHISQEGNTRALAMETLQTILTSNHVNCDKIKLYAAQQFGIYIGGESDS